MDTTELAAELRSADADLPPAEAAFVETVEDAQAKLNAGEIDREQYNARIARASDRYRSVKTMDT